MMFGIEVHQTRESRFSQSKGPLAAFLLIPSVFSCVFTEDKVASGHTSIKHRWGNVAVLFVLLYISPICIYDPGAQLECPSGSWSPL